MDSTLTEPVVTAPSAARGAKAPQGGALWRMLVAANFLALIGVALVLRSWQLGNIPGLNGDEAWLGVEAAHLAAGEPIVWRTPTGNPVNPFMLLPLAALHLISGPSVVVLRSVALASGVAALGANFWLCRRIFGRRTAMVSTTVLAVMPIAIAYSRFAWDTSQTILATVLVLYLALPAVDREVARPGKHKMLTLAGPAPMDWLPALIAFGCALWIHPTNVFALWLLVVPAAYRYGNVWRAKAQGAWEQTGSTKRGWLDRLLALALLGVFAAAAGWICRGLLWTVGSRLFDPEQAGLFLRRLVRLYSGGTVLEFIPGLTGTSAVFQFIPGPARSSTGLDGCDMAFLLLVLVAMLGMLHRLRRDDSGRERSLVWSVALMIGTFYLVAGPDAIAPHFERYGMCLVAPGGVLLALGLSYWLGSRGREKVAAESRGERFRRALQSRLAGVALAALAWLWLGHFYCDYFLAFAGSGGTSHVAFRTAPVEPKLAALETILQREPRSGRPAADRPAGQIWIVADSWWSYWPLAYFSIGQPGVHVVAQDEWPAESRQLGPADAVWQVKFVADDEPGVRSVAAVAEDRPASQTTILDYAGAPLLTVERVEQSAGAR